MAFCFCFFSVCKTYYYISKLVCAVIGEFSGPYSPARTAKIQKNFLLPNCCMIYHQIVLIYIESTSLKISFTLNCILECANDLKTISN